jgi:hypothetical protein
MPDRVKGKTLIAADEGDDAHGVRIKLYSEETNGAISIIEQPFEPGLLLTATRPPERCLALHPRGRDARAGWR